MSMSNVSAAGCDPWQEALALHVKVRAELVNSVNANRKDTEGPWLRVIS